MVNTLKLLSRNVEKPWGRSHLPPFFGYSDGRRVGEIWFEDPAHESLSLLAKYLFTSERLSVQVHPDDVDARRAGASSGKAECWFVVDAEPGAKLGLGLKEALSAASVREAALEGSIESLMSWREARKGDFVFVPAGTIHAIGAGLTLIEVQQNSDITYRLFDYGRSRPLHIDEALEVADLRPFEPSHYVAANDRADEILVSAPQFTVAHIGSPAGSALMRDQVRWVLPIRGSIFAGRESAHAGECLLAGPGEELTVGEGATALVAVAGPIPGGAAISQR